MATDHLANVLPLIEHQCPQIAGSILIVVRTGVLHLAKPLKKNPGTEGDLLEGKFADPNAGEARIVILPRFFSESLPELLATIWISVDSIQSFELFLIISVVTCRSRPEIYTHGKCSAIQGTRSRYSGGASSLVLCLSQAVSLQRKRPILWRMASSISPTASLGKLPKRLPLISGHVWGCRRRTSRLGTQST
jgi:hypothetical protein